METLTISAKPARTVAASLLEAAGLPIQWETFLTTGESTVYGSDPMNEQRANPCCAPTKAA